MINTNVYYIVEIYFVLNELEWLFNDGGIKSVSKDRGDLYSNPSLIIILSIFHIPFFFFIHISFLFFIHNFQSSYNSNLNHNALLYHKSYHIHKSYYCYNFYLFYYFQHHYNSSHKPLINLYNHNSFYNLIQSYIADNINHFNNPHNNRLDNINIKTKGDINISIIIYIMQKAFKLLKISILRKFFSTTYRSENNNK